MIRKLGIAALLAILLAACSPALAGKHNCKPAWKCATPVPSVPAPTLARTPAPTPTVPPSVAPSPTLRPTPSPTLTPTAPPSLAPSSAPSATPSAAPSETPAAGGVYGPAIAADGKDNRILGWTNPGREAAFRWTSSGGSLTGLAVNQRFGPNGTGYSNGDGGLLRITIQSVTAAGIPSGTILGETTYDPVNPGSNAEDKRVIPITATIPAGPIAAVFQNVHAQATTNWMSLNVLWVPSEDVTSPRQPAFPDDSMAVLSRYEFGSSWGVVRTNTPVFDASFADGHHEGQAYAERFVAPQEIIADSNDRVRERFTPSSTLRVAAAWFRVWRQSGSTLSVSLAGQTCSTSIAEVPAERQFNANVWVGARWVRCPLDATIPAGVEQTATFSTDGAIRVAPIREVRGQPNPFWGSRMFTEGVAEKSINGGAWAEMYFSGVADLQFYLELR